MTAIPPGQQPTNLLNVARFALRKPKAALVMARKVWKRLRDGRGRYDASENSRWIAAHSRSSNEVAREIAPELWVEAMQFGKELRARAESIMANVPFDMGSGADYEFLYWLTRYRKPEIIVETGVSAGWTSQAFLAALERNESGTLYSSDFPYFRVKDPESYIGILVEQRLRERWQLSIDGDENALPRIAAAVSRIDLFHYDSDKSYSGREFGISVVRPKLAPDGVMMMDDIEDDSWFREQAEISGDRFAVLNERYGVLGDFRVQ